MGEPAILYKDEEIILLDKPSGLLIHPVEGEESEQTLADWLIKQFPQIQGVGEEGRWGIVHRLDRETSGIMVAALTQQAYTRLKKQFARREVHKTYRAFVYGNMKEERGTIDRAIGRSPSGSRTANIAAGETSRTREAQTTFRTLERSQLASYLELYPKTGRTHQIRVHLSLLQHPVVCDKRYAPTRPAILGFDRLALHAYKLSFAHPLTGKEMTFEAPLPQNFISAESRLSNLLH
jgi:23S rRNA pseudouridine1911/1915/1917 synthase